MSDPAHIFVDGAAQTCNGCHQIFRSASPGGAALNYHADIGLRHGMNNRCVNCHDPANREVLALRDGTTIPFAQAPRLCAECHGTVFRDWERGTHGKTLGSWINQSESQHRLRCNECHNPHAPKYEPYTPLPGPSTLRMGVQNPGQSQGHAQKASPLQRWLRARDAASSGRPAETGGHR